MSTQRVKGQRDPRLDFFRGLGMFIILIAHIPWNSWTEWIPARFGFSDAADLFVFCSGMASALAFATVFDQHGWLRGTARILHRVWQVYWAHIGSFFVVLALVADVDVWRGGDFYAAGLRIEPVLADFRSYVGPIMTMRYVPNYFDILPMYLAILAMVPVAMALERASPKLAIAAVLATWLVAQLGWLSLTADAITGRQWFFNPFGWELVFFSGFAFARGWLPPPPRDAGLATVAAAFVIVAAPISCQTEFSCFALWGHAPALGASCLARPGDRKDDDRRAALRAFHGYRLSGLSRGRHAGQEPAWLACGARPPRRTADARRIPYGPRRRAGARHDPRRDGPRLRDGRARQSCGLHDADRSGGRRLVVQGAALAQDAEDIARPRTPSLLRRRTFARPRLRARSFRPSESRRSVDRCVHDFFFGRFRRGEFLDHLALAADENAVRQRHDLRQV